MHSTVCLKSGSTALCLVLSTAQWPGFLPPGEGCDLQNSHDSTCSDTVPFPFFSSRGVKPEPQTSGARPTQPPLVASSLAWLRPRPFSLGPRWGDLRKRRGLRGGTAMQPGLRSPTGKLQPETGASRPGELPSPAAGGERRGWRHVGARPGRAISQCGGGGGGSGDRGLLFGAAAGGPRSGEAGGLPQLARSRHTLEGVGRPPPGPGLALGAAAPPQARPARPEGRNRPGLPARPRHLRSRLHYPPCSGPEAAFGSLGRRHEDQGCQETL